LFPFDLLSIGPALVLRLGNGSVFGGDRAGRHAVEIDAIGTGDQRIQIFAVADIDAQRGGYNPRRYRVTELRGDVVVDPDLERPAIRTG
jgi:hypothetical protein